MLSYGNFTRSTLRTCCVSSFFGDRQRAEDGVRTYSCA